MSEEKCLFCNIPKQRIIMENRYAYAIRDGFPVVDLHTLIIPKVHTKDYFGLSNVQLIGCDSLLHLVKNEILEMDKSVEGFNIGINCGEVSGQTIFHCHIHLMPRRVGDVPNPRGGVRHIIPGKGNY